MTIEVLYPEVANLYGDPYNVRYLAASIQDVKVHTTALTEPPLFAETRPDLIYMGPMPERAQELVIQALLPYKDRISELIADGVVFLFTGNALECLGTAIENEDGTQIKGLDLFHGTAKRKMFQRYNSLYLGSYNNIKIVGYKNQFTQGYYENSENYFTKTIRGGGIHPNTDLEGIVIKNFFGTYLLGPILLLNPLLTKQLLLKMGVSQDPLYFEESLSAYKQRLLEYENPSTKL